MSWHGARVPISSHRLGPGVPPAPAAFLINKTTPPATSNNCFPGLVAAHSCVHCPGHLDGVLGASNGAVGSRAQQALERSNNYGPEGRQCSPSGGEQAGVWAAPAPRAVTVAPETGSQLLVLSASPKSRLLLGPGDQGTEGEEGQGPATWKALKTPSTKGHSPWPPTEARCPPHWSSLW